MVPTAGSLLEMMSHSSKDNPTTPKHKRGKSAVTATTASSSFMPEYNSTPPMPAVPTPKPMSKGKENAAPTPTRKPVPGQFPDNETIPSLVEAVGAKAPARPFYTTDIFNDRFQELPPLPSAWAQHHDRAICVLDARNYSHTMIVSKIRKVFPELRGTLTPPMIERRLRILDQNVDIDYWRVGLRNRPSAATAASRIDSTNTLSVKGQSSTSREPTLKATPSGSLLKSSSRGKLLPDTASATGSSPGMMVKDFGVGKLKSRFERTQV